MAFSLVIRGVGVEASAGGKGVQGRVCLTRAHDLIAEGPIGSNGSFVLTASLPSPDTYQFTIYAGGLEAVRRSMVLDGSQTEIDLGTMELSRAEYPPGIHGHLWDRTRDRMISSGQVRLEQAGEPLVTERLGLDGTFSIEMGCTQPLPPGEYDLVGEAAGYAPGRVRVVMADEETSCQIGRIELSTERDTADVSG